ncbi:dehydration-responsive element-binding protein 2D [Dorcoceras hygrometricum]|uniref:Dehydration-responsive element-binding protein 2D n=1 Tax=Dorcoceras hygrometricum TaxID=472368 RepID=A0A2Z7BRK8_9LAMI|nr:dehydration-responsive element-binding protein 2D [Dorcoceras hygrometricum]
MARSWLNPGWCAGAWRGRRVRAAPLTSCSHASWLMAGAVACSGGTGWTQGGPVDGAQAKGGRSREVEGLQEGVAQGGGMLQGWRVCMDRPIRLHQLIGFGWTGSIERAEHLGSLGLNGAGDYPVDFIPNDVKFKKILESGSFQLVSELWFWWGTSLLWGARKSHYQYIDRSTPMYVYEDFTELLKLADSSVPLPVFDDVSFAGMRCVDDVSLAVEEVWSLVLFVLRSVFCWREVLTTSFHERSVLR